MKKSFFLIVFSLLTALTIWADNNDKTSSKVDLRLLKRCPSEPLPGRPRMPSNQYLLFSYNGETQECVFTLREEIEYLSIYIVECETGLTYTGEVTQEDPVMMQTILPGYYRITCLTDEGDIYEGEGPIE